jgi:hypothetical protein
MPISLIDHQMYCNYRRRYPDAELWELFVELMYVQSYSCSESRTED